MLPLFPRVPDRGDVRFLVFPTSQWSILPPIYWFLLGFDPLRSITLASLSSRSCGVLFQFLSPDQIFSCSLTSWFQWVSHVLKGMSHLSWENVFVEISGTPYFYVGFIVSSLFTLYLIFFLFFTRWPLYVVETWVGCDPLRSSEISSCWGDLFFPWVGSGSPSAEYNLSLRFSSSYISLYWSDGISSVSTRPEDLLHRSYRVFGQFWLT